MCKEGSNVEEHIGRAKTRKNDLNQLGPITFPTLPDACIFENTHFSMSISV